MQWDHGTKIILRRLFQFVHCTTYKATGPLDQDYIVDAFFVYCSRYKVMGPWDQDYNGEAFSICTMHYVQSHGTMEPRLYGEAFSICTLLCIKQWDHGTKIILGRLFQFVNCTRYKAMGPWDQDYIGEVLSIDAIN
jgi:hypothetical protein